MPERASIETMAQARQRYFEANDFGPDGGYSKKLVWFEFGPLKLPIPNTASRVHAVRYHDLHHVLTGYPTDWRGEFEIASWEIGAGCADAWFAWGINLGGLVGGLLTIPARTARAFFRGRRSQSLYRFPHDPLLERAVGDLRRETGVDDPPPTPGAADWLALAGWSAVGLIGVAVQAAALLGPPALLAWWLLSR